MRTWTITLPKCEPLTAQVWAHDEREAIELAAVKLGISAVPCCELDDPPCYDCRREDELTATMRAEDRAIEAARKDGRL